MGEPLLPERVQQRVPEPGGSASPPVLIAQPDLPQPSLLSILWRRRWVVVLTLVVCLGGGFAYLWRATPLYTSTSRLYVERKGPKILTDGEGVLTQSFEDRILTLADNRAYVLIELPPDTFINAEPLLEKLAVRRVTPILSHPERNSFLAREPRAALPWLTHGGLLQVTAGSLLGDFGPLAESAAWHWLATGAVALVGTDAHNTADRGPCITQAIETIARRLGNPLAYRTCLLNPLRVLSGKRIRPNAHLLRREMVR